MIQPCTCQLLRCHDQFLYKVVYTEHMIDSQPTTRTQESNSSLSATTFYFFLSLRLHHQMWFSNLNNQKGLVTSSQNTQAIRRRNKTTLHDRQELKQRRLIALFLNPFDCMSKWGACQVDHFINHRLQMGWPATTPEA